LGKTGRFLAWSARVAMHEYARDGDPWTIPAQSASRGCGKLGSKWIRSLLAGPKNESKAKELKMNLTDLNTARLVTDLKRIIIDSEALLHATKDAVGDKASEVRERLTDALDAAKRTCHRLEEKALHSAKAADQTIRDHPYQSIGVAIGIGLLIGVLVTRK
jgi:ElaB/YqjD/DUF883 family membrane-anchored ribosome-binding protein